LVVILLLAIAGYSFIRHWSLFFYSPLVIILLLTIDSYSFTRYWWLFH
jgi:hypothetical protein